MSVFIPKALEEKDVKHLSSIICSSIEHLESIINNPLSFMDEKELQHYELLLKKENQELKALKETYPECFL